MIYNQVFTRKIQLETPVFVEQISGVEYPTREAAEAACHATMFDLNCSVSGDASSHIRIVRSLEQFQELYKLRMAQQ